MGRHIYDECLQLPDLYPITSLHPHDLSSCPDADIKPQWASPSSTVPLPPAYLDRYDFRSSSSAMYSLLIIGLVVRALVYCSLRLTDRARRR